MSTLESIRRVEKELARRFDGKLTINGDLNRTLVSFQANKRQTRYRWFKYKEGFSASLVCAILDKLQLDRGLILYSFAAPAAACSDPHRGLDAVGIELLPVGCEVIGRENWPPQPRLPPWPRAARWRETKPWRRKRSIPFRHLRITQGAFPSDAEISLGHYLAAADQEPPSPHCSVSRRYRLEDVSYTRKDGQYLHGITAPAESKG